MPPNARDVAHGLPGMGHLLPLEGRCALKVMPAAGVVVGPRSRKGGCSPAFDIRSCTESMNTREPSACATEWVDGLTLTQVLAARGLLGGHEAALISVIICRAVAAVRGASVLHRDIKAQAATRSRRPHRVDGLRRGQEFEPKMRATQPANRDAALSGSRTLCEPSRDHRQRHLHCQRAPLSPHDRTLSRRRCDVQRDRCAARPPTLNRSVGAAPRLSGAAREDRR